jgi:hypothetical protein
MPRADCPNGTCAGSSLGQYEMSLSAETISITGSYVRPPVRAEGVNAMLDASLWHYAAMEFVHSAVDLESINPEATDFWNCYFTPVCFSVFRHAEAML